MTAIVETMAKHSSSYAHVQKSLLCARAKKACNAFQGSAGGGVLGGTRAREGQRAKAGLRQTLQADDLLLDLEPAKRRRSLRPAV